RERGEGPLHRQEARPEALPPVHRVHGPPEVDLGARHARDASRARARGGDQVHAAEEPTEPRRVPEAQGLRRPRASPRRTTAEALPGDRLTAMATPTQYYATGRRK